jgi:hypothetical protein
LKILSWEHRLFVSTSSSRINAHFLNSIMWFIFNLQRKNIHLEIAAGIYSCIVPDRRSRDLEVVVVSAQLTWVLGIWNGEGVGRG